MESSTRKIAITALSLLAVLSATTGLASAEPTDGGAAPVAGTSSDDAHVPERPWWTRHGAVTTPPPATSIVVVPGDVLFDTGSAELSLAAQSQLASIIDTLTAHPTITATVEGHTDSDGDPVGNQTLSLARAEAVAAWFEAQGVAANRLSTTGWGETRPVAPNDTPEHKAANRRVVITLTANTS